MSSKKAKKSAYEIFKERCTYWRKLFCVNDVLISVSPAALDSNDASYSYDPQARTALIKFDDEENEDATFDELNYLAFHEIKHILLADFEYMVRSREFDEKRLETTIHRVIISDWRREMEG